MKTKKNKGFTLVELLVVIGIIAILGSIVLSSLSHAKARGRDARRAGDIKQLQQAVENYFENNDVYPPALTDPSFAALLSGIDPVTGEMYGYAVQADPASYCIGVNFEQGVEGNLPPSNACIAGYNYSVSNGNFNAVCQGKGCQAEGDVNPGAGAGGDINPGGAGMLNY